MKGDVSGYRERLVKFVEARSIELHYSDKIAPAKGLSHGGKITLHPHCHCGDSANNVGVSGIADLPNLSARMRAWNQNQVAGI